MMRMILYDGWYDWDEIEGMDAATRAAFQRLKEDPANDVVNIFEIN